MTLVWIALGLGLVIGFVLGIAVMLAILCRSQRGMVE